MIEWTVKEQAKYEWWLFSEGIFTPNPEAKVITSFNPANSNIRFNQKLLSNILMFNRIYRRNKSKQELEYVLHNYRFYLHRNGLGKLTKKYLSLCKLAREAV